MVLPAIGIGSTNLSGAATVHLETTHPPTHTHTHFSLVLPPLFTANQSRFRRPGREQYLVVSTDSLSLSLLLPWGLLVIHVPAQLSSPIQTSASQVADSSWLSSAASTPAGTKTASPGADSTACATRGRRDTCGRTWKNQAEAKEEAEAVEHPGSQESRPGGDDGGDGGRRTRRRRPEWRTRREPAYRRPLPTGVKRLCGRRSLGGEPVVVQYSRCSQIDVGGVRTCSATTCIMPSRKKKKKNLERKVDLLAFRNSLW